MSLQRRKFDKEFKLMTVELSKNRNNLNELAQELDIRVELVYRWQSELLAKREGSFPGHGKPKHTPEEAEAPRSGDGKRYPKKGHQHLLQGRQEIYRSISDNNARFSVEKMFKVLQVSRSGNYEYLKSVVCKREEENKKLLVMIKQLYQKSKQRYGSPRIQQVLKAQHMAVSRPRVAGLMKQAHIKAQSQHQYAGSENLLKRNFTAATLGQAWVSGITYIQTIAGWLYLTIVLDLADRKVVVWALSETMKAQDTTLAALKIALKNRTITQALIFIRTEKCNMPVRSSERNYKLVV